MAVCPQCESAFSPPRSNAKYCGPRCKDTAKKQRRRSDPEKALRELEAQRLAYQRTVAERRYGFAGREGFSASAPRRATPVRLMVEDVIDHDDDFSDWAPATHPLPVWQVAVVPF